MKMLERAKILSKLSRLPIALVASYSALTGYLLAGNSRLIPALTAAAGVFLLACGASALNQIQERHFDSLMERTRFRPLPSQKITRTHAFTLASMFIVTGLLLLSLSGIWLTVLLGIFALAWYNGVYTFLKRMSAFAAVPGAVVGMAPPAIGWTAAGGMITDARLWPLCFFFFLWQVPHFWLQVLDHGREYEQAGFPSLSRVFTEEQLARVNFIWICAAAVSGLFLPLYADATRSPVVFVLLLSAAVIVILTGIRLLSASRKNSVHFAFRAINAYMMMTMTLLTAESIRNGL